MAEARRGRPRSPEVHEAILQAARELVIDYGYAGVSMDRIAAHAGVALQSLYRRWPHKAPLVAEAIMSMYGDGVALEVPVTDDIADDLSTWMRQNTVEVLSPHTRLLRSLAAAAAENPRDNDDLFRQLGEPHVQSILRRLRHGVDAAQIRPDANLESVADAMMGASLFRVMAGDTSMEETMRRFEGLIDALIVGIRLQHRDLNAGPFA